MSLAQGFSWVGKIPWGRAWQPTPVFLPENPHGQRVLEGYNPWGCKELDTSEQLSTAHDVVMVLGGNTFWRCLGHEGGTLMDGISALMKETPENSLVFS